MLTYCRTMVSFYSTQYIINLTVVQLEFYASRFQSCEKNLDLFFFVVVASARSEYQLRARFHSYNILHSYIDLTMNKIYAIIKEKEDYYTKENKK